ncbi:DUF2804 domain-containing protein [Pseudoalteromonas sp. T1lg22]|uniref:DUF2804 domain-containing protein n=1 Tax=Pseudoalteromonas sp. T1lg22 TaxID=2077096 RepID=UPI000CF6BC09|nr:DUF2804 domain-containing protein [Pseudoalteromonas sp. T1lg22]
MKMDILPIALGTETGLDTLVSESGKVHFGHLNGPIQAFGLEHFNYTNAMDKPAGRLAKHFHFKQFQFVSVITPRFLIGVAIADIRYAASGFCYLYDIEANKLVETSWLKPLSLGCTMAPSPWEGCSSLGGAGGKISMEINAGVWQLRIATKQISADFTLIPPTASLPMALCNPTGYSGWTYTQKHNALGVQGSLVINQEAQDLEHALAGYDFSAGFMRRETSWRWASINGRIGGSLFGLNLAAGVNETGYNENVFWRDGERHLLGPVHFDFTRRACEQDWQISSQDGKVSLTFSPLNKRQERLNLGLLKSNFRQYIGHFNGQIEDAKGRLHRLDNVLGLTEDHYALW